MNIPQPNSLCRDAAADAAADSGVPEYAARSALLFSIAGLLKRYADEHDLLVVTTNQVRADVSPPIMWGLTCHHQSGGS